jgi:hypothetical protein
MVLCVDWIIQTFLVPLDLRYFIRDDYICFYILDIVNQLDCTDLEDKYRYNAGKPAY